MCAEIFWILKHNNAIGGFYCCWDDSRYDFYNRLQKYPWQKRYLCSDCRFNNDEDCHKTERPHAKEML